MQNTTKNLELNLIKYNQAQKEITANEAFYALDAFINPSIEEIIENLGSAKQDGSLYILDKKIFYYLNGWRKISAKEGWILWIKSKRKFYFFNGELWEEINLQCKNC